MDDILVSVVCNTYNQEDYIRDALEGFVMQKTTFPFEILVHDDASTDATASIVKEYEDKYPDLIKPIYQTENQYSKRVSISKTFQFPRAKGRYIAFCEGDDYWTDPLKLQKQADALERHPETDICAHQTATVRDGKQTGVVPASSNSTVYTVEEVIAGGGGFVATASLMFRKTLFENEYEFAKRMSLDYIWQISGALRGGMVYIGDCMGVYRQRAKGSYTTRGRKNPAGHIANWTKIRETLRALDEETSHAYETVIGKQMALMDLNIWVRQGEWKAMLSSEGRKKLVLQPPAQRVLMVLQAIRWRLADRAAKLAQKTGERRGRKP